jgi:hypothetical protein
MTLAGIGLETLAPRGKGDARADHRLLVPSRRRGHLDDADRKCWSGRQALTPPASRRTAAYSICARLGAPAEPLDKSFVGARRPKDRKNWTPNWTPPRCCVPLYGNLQGFPEWGEALATCDHPVLSGPPSGDTKTVTVQSRCSAGLGERGERIAAGVGAEQVGEVGEQRAVL